MSRKTAMTLAVLLVLALPRPGPKSNGRSRAVYVSACERITAADFRSAI